MGLGVQVGFWMASTRIATVVGVGIASSAFPHEPNITPQTRLTTVNTATTQTGIANGFTRIDFKWNPLEAKSVGTRNNLPASHLVGHQRS